MILLEEINRLNQKVTGVDSERLDVINHLMNAENYIQELESKHNAFEFNSESAATNAQTAVGQSSSNIQQELNEKEHTLRFEVAQRDLKIVFLLEEINRLNHKEAELKGQLGGSSISQGSSSELNELRHNKERIESELQEVLEHLRKAEEYIQEVGENRDQLEQERNYLVEELNRIQSMR